LEGKESDSDSDEETTEKLTIERKNDPVYINPGGTAVLKIYFLNSSKKTMTIRNLQKVGGTYPLSYGNDTIKL